MRLCMVAYSEYFYDARIKSYVEVLNNAGHFVDLIVIADEESAENIHKKIEFNNNRLYFVSRKYRGNSQLLYLASYVIFFIISFFVTSVLFIKEKYKVVHVHNMPNFIVFSGLIPKLFGSRIILDVHDLMIPIYLAKFDNKIMKTFVERMLNLEQKISFGFADNIICADHIQKKDLVNDMIIKESKVNVLMNLPNENIFKIVNVPRASDKFNLIYHGTISRRLGIDFLLHAVNKVKDKMPVKLHLYGNGEYLKDIVNMRKSMDLEEIVYIHGKGVPAEQLSKIICGMDAGIIGNRYSPATNKYMMPVKLMEYVFHKIPVIAPRLDIIKYYFIEEMVKYYDPENIEQMCECILYLYCNPSERKKIAETAYKFFDNNKIDEQNRAYLHLVCS